MATKLTRKGRNPGAVDNWLDTLGLYRKNVAYDETCLFRAVSEQIFNCQVYHERVRRECIAYARENFHEFSFIFDEEKKWNEHLDSLEKHMVVCGNVEIEIISRKYNRDVIVFDAARQHLVEVTKRNLKESLLLCLMDEDHYDVVYKREHILTAGFCQSIVYKILYENVFKIQHVDEIVNAMLYDKNSIVTQGQLLAEKKLIESNNNTTYSDLNMVFDESNEDDESDEIKLVTETSTNIAPFPFKVAKALDPTIYRNIEYDSWGEVRREMRLGDWYYGDDKLILGTRCILNNIYNDETFECYIQDILKDSNQCVVYLTKLAERRTVNYTDLSPEDDAKPWPLPYRFSKNLVIGTTSPVVNEKPNKSSKKRNKDKRRTKSWSESSAISNSPTSVTETIDNVNQYVGAPLQMHTPSDSSYNSPEQQPITEMQEIQQQQEVMTPDSNTVPPNTRYQWEQPQWHYMPQTPDPFVWPTTPSTPQSMVNYNLRPMIASAPVTPDVVPYHDPNFPYYYTYHVDPSYNPYAQWSPQASDYYNASQNQLEDNKLPEDTKGQKTNDSQYVSPPTNDVIYEPNTTPERPSLCTTLTPQNNQPVDVYSPVIPIQPGTPVIYTQDMTEVVMPTTPIAVYTPAVDIQYLPTTPYVYPPTPPPAAWYPAGINSQGFIFPTPINTQTVFQNQK